MKPAAVLFVFVLLLAPVASAQEVAVGAPVRHLVLLERGPHWPASNDSPYRAALDEHRAAMQALFAEGRVLIGGPATDLSCGILVLDVAERAEVERLVAADPAVAAGVFVADIRAFHGLCAADLQRRSATSPAVSELSPTPPSGGGDSSLPSPAASDPSMRPALSSPASSDLAPVRHEIVVPAPLSAVWHAWSTAEGAETFLAPEVRLELRPQGALDVLWMPDAPPGRRGAEDLRVLAFVPERLLAFEWSAPPQFPRARPERTFVLVELEPLDARQTRVTLLHQGFAEQALRAPDAADEWRQVRAYFVGAWAAVLGALEQRFTSGPVDWAAARPATPGATAK